MSEQRYYRDSEYGDWVIVTEGKNPLRQYGIICDEDFFLGTRPDLGKEDRISSPPNGNPDWWFTGRAWRREPARKMSLDREGIHAAKGLLMGLMVGAALIVDAGIWVALAISALVWIRFLAYEVTEGMRIRDWAYRDLGGELIGFMLPVVPALLYYIYT